MAVLRESVQRARVIVSFSPGDWCVFAEALSTLVLVQVALRTMPLRRVIAWAARSQPSPSSHISSDRVARLAWLVDLAARLARRRCLVRSLTLNRVLSRRAICTDLRIGVRSSNGRFTS